MNTSKQPKGSNEFTSKESLRTHPLNAICFATQDFSSCLPCLAKTTKFLHL